MEDQNTAGKYHQLYLEAKSRLNPAQLKAVETIEGPVLVVAGPGAGKTTVLTTRIGEILLRTDARPQNILCLTFTDAASVNMRHRLLHLIGPEAHNVAIHTYHAFCNRVIQENIEYFDTPRRLELLRDLDRADLMARFFEEMPIDHPLLEGKKHTEPIMRQAENLFDVMAKEGWTPEYVRGAVQQHLDSLPENPDFRYKRALGTFKIGDLKEAEIKKQTDYGHRIIAAAELFPAWNALLRREGFFEYVDMINWVNAAFKHFPDLLLNYQERYQYILVDEYQDTNGAQAELLGQLINYWDAPNVFIVGDDDQSIYEFQGARLKNLLNFYKRYESSLELVLLNENYRTVAGLLDPASLLIQQNKLRAARFLEGVFEKKSLAMRVDTTVPEVFAYENTLYELTGLVQQIGNCLQEGIQAAEIAVLYRENRQADDLMRLLDHAGIAYDTQRALDILDLPIIRHFLALLTYLHLENDAPMQQDGLLFRVLNLPFFGFDSLDSARLYAVRAAYLSEENQEIKPISLREGLSDARFLEKNLKPDVVARFLTFSKKIENWIRVATDIPLAELLRMLFSEADIVAWASQQSDKVWLIQVLHTFHDFVASECTRRPDFDLAQLVKVLDRMREKGIAIRTEQQVRTGNGIRLMTVHRSKGLEFDTVFMFDCSQRTWIDKKGGGGMRFSLPETLTLSGEEDSLEALRRLFFVGMTRARNRLFLSYSKKTNRGDATEPIQFLAEAGLQPKDNILEASAVVEAQIQLLTKAKAPLIQLPEDLVLNNLMENFRLSISALNRFLRCRLAFYYTDFLKIPDTSSPASVYGQAMHAAMQHFFEKMRLSQGRVFGTSADLVGFFKKAMEERRAFLPKRQYEHLLKFGSETLTGYSGHHAPNWNNNSVVERRIRRTEVDGVPLTGILDRVDFHENGTIQVVDYKTGNPLGNATKAKLKRGDNENPLGGDYYRQALFYKLLLESSGMYPGHEVAQVQITFFEPTKKNDYIDEYIRPDSKSLKTFRKTLVDTWDAIRAFDFREGCGEPDCAWCKFHAGENLASDRGQAEELLDDN